MSGRVPLLNFLSYRLNLILNPLLKPAGSRSGAVFRVLCNLMVISEHAI